MHFAAKQSGLVATDESQVMEAIGRPPWLIRGRRSNIKLTYPEDLELIEALLSARGGRIVMIRIGQGFDVHEVEPGME